MDRYKLTTILIASVIFLFSLPVVSIYAQTNELNNSSDNHTTREEQEGKKIWEQLQSKETSCDKLSDDNFQALGEYYMGQMTGASHEAMNAMMIQMMGEQGEEQMHVVMGKRLSGCNTSAEIPQNGTSFMPMMWMMRGGQQDPFNQTGSPMVWNSWTTLSSLLFQFTIVVWLIVGVLATVWLFRQISKK